MLLGSGGNLRVTTELEAREQSSRVVKFPAFGVDFGQVELILLVARVQANGGLLGLHGGCDPAALDSSETQQVVGLGKFRIPIDDHAEIKERVG